MLKSRTGIPCLVIATLLLSSCATTATRDLQRLDPETGVTVSRASAPVVMYRDMSAHSAYGREYVYLGPVQVNNMGQREYYLWFGIWGTSDSIDRGRKMDDFEAVVLYADGEPLELEVRGWTHGSIGVSRDVYTKPVAAALDAYYRVSIDQLRLIAESSDLELRAGAIRPQRYTPWESASGSSQPIVAFLQDISW